MRTMNAMSTINVLEPCESCSTDLLYDTAMSLQIAARPESAVDELAQSRLLRFLRFPKRALLRSVR